MTLFHRLDDGERIIPFNRLIDAQPKTVWNPGKKERGKHFAAGFHVLPFKHLAEDYLRRFKDKDDLRVVRVYVPLEQVRPKPRSEVYLSPRMLLVDTDWEAVNVSAAA